MPYTTPKSIDIEYKLPTPKTLVILAGVSTSGKTTLLKSLMMEKTPGLCQKLGLTVPQKILFFNRRLKDLKKLSLEHSSKDMVVDFDFFHNVTQKKDLEFQLLLALIKNSQQTIVLTLCASSAALYQRLKHRVDKYILETGMPDQQDPDFQQRIKYMQYMQNTLTLYQNKDELLKHYQNWEMFVISASVNHHLLMDSSTPKLSLSGYSLKKTKAILNKTAKIK